MDPERPPQLRTVTDADSVAQESAAPLQPAFDVNPLAELVADVIEATNMLPADKLAFVRERARTGSFAQALIDEGLAEGASIARTLGARHNLPVVDIVDERVHSRRRLGDQRRTFHFTHGANWNGTWVAQDNAGQQAPP